MESIIEKLSKMEYSKNPWKSWSLEEKKKLLEMYLTIAKNEEYIYELIYSIHGCDSWEDIFRDYDYRYLEDKVSGIQEAVDILNENSDDNKCVKINLPKVKNENSNNT